MNKFDDVERFDPELEYDDGCDAYASMGNYKYGGYVSYEDYKELLDAYKALVEKQEEKE